MEKNNSSINNLLSSELNAKLSIIRIVSHLLCENSVHQSSTIAIINKLLIKKLKSKELSALVSDIDFPIIDMAINEYTNSLIYFEENHAVIQKLIKSVYIVHSLISKDIENLSFSEKINIIGNIFLEEQKIKMFNGYLLGTNIKNDYLSLKKDFIEYCNLYRRLLNCQHRELQTAKACVEKKSTYIIEKYGEIFRITKYEISTLFTDINGSDSKAVAV